jgi:hypothetical protein
MNLDHILYAPSTDPLKVKFELEKIFTGVEVEYRRPYEPLFDLQIRCYNEAGDTLKIIRYGYSGKQHKWFFEDVTPEIQNETV